MRVLTNYELDLVCGGTSSSETILVTGYYYYEDMSWAFYDPMTDVGGGGGGGGGTPSNTEIPVANDDSPCEDGAAVKAAAEISGLINSVGNYEFSGLLINNGNGTYGLNDNELSTLYSPTNSSFDSLDSYAGVYGLIHNHTFNDSNYNSNFLNRYPSDRDWEALDIMVQGGADPNHLSIFILDPFGDLREFPYSSKSLYQGMTDSQRYQGANLPNETQSCS